MDKRNLDKQKTIKEQRRTKELAALAAEAAGQPIAETERLLISPLGINESQTAAVLTYTNEVQVKTKEKDNEDENINRLVHDNREDTKSVKSFGKRTDVEPNNQEDIK